MNSKGVTLVEVMISLVILLVVFMGLIQASLLSINSNLRNEIRDESVKLASEYMSNARGVSVDTLAAGNVCNAANNVVFNINRNFRNLAQAYSITRSSCFTDATLSAARVTVTVSFIYPNDVVANTQTVTSIVKR